MMFTAAPKSLDSGLAVAMSQRNHKSLSINNLINTQSSGMAVALMKQALARRVAGESERGGMNHVDDC